MAEGAARWTSPAVRAAAAVRGPVFLLAVAVVTWVGLRGRTQEVAASLRATDPAAAVVALCLVTAGLLVTAVLWRLLMRRAGGPVPWRGGLAVFFVGQLGKYLPGSVWSIGAQADLARRHGVSVRSTVAAGLLFLGYHVDTAVLVAGGAVLLGALEVPVPTWCVLAGLAAGVVGLLPEVVTWAARRVAGTAVRVRWRDSLVAVTLMAVVWAAYGGALVLLAPGASWADAPALAGAFAGAYAVGVVVVVAPAGFGAREAVFVVLAAPVLGTASATALALLARVVHTAADAALAAGCWLVARRSPQARGSVSSSSALPSAGRPPRST